MYEGELNIKKKSVDKEGKTNDGHDQIVVVLEGLKNTGLISINNDYAMLVNLNIRRNN